MCLVHLPLTIGIPGLLAPVALPALVKGAIVLGVTVCLTVWTYDRFVRLTAVGALLTGGATRARPSAAAPRRFVAVASWTAPVEPSAPADGWVGTWPCIACEG